MEQNINFYIVFTIYPSSNSWSCHTSKKTCYPKIKSYPSQNYMFLLFLSPNQIILPLPIHPQKLASKATTNDFKES